MPKPSLFRKRLLISFIVQILVLGFSAILVTRCIAIPYWNESPCCLSSYVESEIIVLKPCSPVPTIVCSTYCQRRKAGRELSNCGSPRSLYATCSPIFLLSLRGCRAMLLSLSECRTMLLSLMQWLWGNAVEPQWM